MANTQQPAGNLTRRDFIKTTTAATAAASVGIAPDIVHETTLQPSGTSSDFERQPIRQWSITGEQIQMLWTEIHPIIVACSWEDPVFQERFEKRGTAFRTAAVNTVAASLGYDGKKKPLFKWPDNLFIRIDTANSRITDFHLKVGGIWLPWPDSPFPASKNVTDIKVAYSLMGGLLPRATANALYTQEEKDLLKDIRTKLHGLTANPSDPTIGTHSLSGPSLPGQTILSLLDQLPKIVARAWSDATFRNKYQNTPYQVITDINLPNNARLEKPFAGQQVLKIQPNSAGSELILIPPFPNNLPDKSIVFNELILGYASNPMYSNCY